MTTTIIISICVLLLIAYIFDISSSKTKIPSVVLLLILGWTVRQLTNYLHINIPDLSSILPLIGTIGLILIVLEGSLELELNQSKMALVGKTSLIAFVPMLIFSLVLAYAFCYYGNISYKIGLANAIPFAIISSAIAIPSVQNLSLANREFITYESSLSDIFGVVLFNFVTMNEIIDGGAFVDFSIELVITLTITFVSTIGLALLLSKINHHVKFLPIILIILLIYNISKVYHLPALIFILLFGIFMGNLDEIKHLKFIQLLKPEILDKEVHKFKELTTEIAFLVRTLFFILFGYLIQTAELLNTDTLVWSISITASIFGIRYVFLKIFNYKISPLLFISPRGLITILLFMSIPASQTTALVNNSLILQVIIMSALVMMLGLMLNKKLKPLETPELK